MKKKKLIVRLRECGVGWNHSGSYEWEAVHDGERVVMAVGGYSRKSDAKRGMIRFLESMGADVNCIEWEES